MPTIELVSGTDGSYSCPTDPGEPCGGKRVSITEEEGKILADLVKGKRVLEIGTGLGVSTRYMARTARIVYTVDVDPWVKENVWPELEEVGYIVCIDYPWEAVDVEVAFIDGLHTKEQVIIDIRAAIAYGCKTIIGHDMTDEAVKAAFSSQFEQIEIIPTHWKLGVAHVG